MNVGERVKGIIARNPVFLDTETTGKGPNDEIVEIAIIDCDGTLLVNTLVRPTIPIPPDVTRIHGIRDADVADAPTILDLLPQLDQIMAGRDLVIYNREFDLRLLRQSIRVRDPDSALQISLSPGECHCAMLLYAEHHGVWDDYHGNWSWQKLEAAGRQCRLEVRYKLHRALADAELTRQIMLHIARSSDQSQA